MSNAGKQQSGSSLPAIALSLLSGVGLLQLQPNLQIALWVEADILFLLPICVWLFYRLPHRRVFLAFLCGYLWALLFAHTYMTHRLAENLAGQDLLIEGVVTGLPEKSGQSVRFDFEVTQYKDKALNLSRSMPSHLRLSWYYNKNEIHTGQHWRLMVRLKPPHGMQNPGGFDYEKWLYLQGVHASGYVRKSDKNQLTGVVTKGIDSVRENLLKILSALPDSTYAGLLQALSIGHKSAISTQQWEILRLTGTSHLMAISGLHIGLVAGLVFLLVRRLVPAFICQYAGAAQIAAVASLIVAGFYALLAGLSIPTQRAFVMLLVLMLAVLIKRPALSINTLSLAIIAVLLFNPVSLLSVGFWLSFLAVSIIALVSSARVKLQQNRLNIWLQRARIQWFIALGMLVPGVLLFQQGSFISPLANMLVIPLVGTLVVPLTLLASLASLISVDLSLWLFSLSSDLLSFVWLILEWLAQTPLASWQRSSVPLFYSFLALSGVALLLMPTGFPLRYAGVILLLPMISYQQPKPEQGHFWVDVLDVGQGLSVLVRTRDKALLYDTGAKFSQKFDIGQRVVLPYLNYIGLQQLDILMISHADNDHAGGADSILKSVKVKSLIAEGDVARQKSRSPVTDLSCKAGQSWHWNEVNFAVIHPAKHYKKSNNRSCVLKVWNDAYSLLLSGDIESKVEADLLRYQAEQLQADVLLVPHHGSNTSSSRAWIDRLKPQLAVVSAGYRNRFGHPTRKVMARYYDSGVPLINTAESGMLQIKLPVKPGEGLNGSQQQRKLAKHYWNHRF